MTSPAAGSYLAGDPVQLTADFSDGSKKVTMWTDGGTGTWAKLGSASNDQTTSSSGDKTFTVAAAPMKLQARTSTGLLTNIVELAPTAATAQVPEFSADGKTVTAKFGQPRNGRQAVLEVQRIVTTETNETDPTNPRPCKQLDSGKGLPDCSGPWTTRATSTQSSTGTATFKISSPYLVPHAYRVRSGDAVSAPVTPAGLVLPAKNTGLPQVYFNTNEGATVDTRNRSFEGQFSMTTGSNLPECTAVLPTSSSTLKGRGNYSWSFKKKGYTLKLGKKTDLCGMGKSRSGP